MDCTQSCCVVLPYKPSEKWQHDIPIRTGGVYVMCRVGLYEIFSRSRCSSIDTLVF